MGSDQTKDQEASAIAVLCDASLLWGIMLRRALSSLQIPYYCLNSSEILQGKLKEKQTKTLIIPGGWASIKSKLLGKKGRQCIKDFVHEKGVYIGICGGAGLALDSGSHALGLCPWSRKPMQKRLPNCSGHIYVQVDSDSELCPQNIRLPLPVPVWWPSQFKPGPSSNTRIIASYAQPADDFWVSDLPAQELQDSDIRYFENLYGINLQPSNLLHEPAIIQGKYGQGTYLLSYVHLETPDSPLANTWLNQMLNRLAFNRHPAQEDMSVPEWDLQKENPVWDDPVIRQGNQIVREIIQAGQTNFVLCWRKPWLLGWRRGIPGFALNTLLALYHEAQGMPPGNRSITFWEKHKADFQKKMFQFRDKFMHYLIRERFQLSQEQSSPESSSSQEIQACREELVGKFPGQGGIFGYLAEKLEELLWLQLTDNRYC